MKTATAPPGTAPTAFAARPAIAASHPATAHRNTPPRRSAKTRSHARDSGWSRPAICLSADPKISPTTRPAPRTSWWTTAVPTWASPAQAVCSRRHRSAPHCARWTRIVMQTPTATGCARPISPTATHAMRTPTASPDIAVTASAAPKVSAAWKPRTARPHSPNLRSAPRIRPARGTEWMLSAPVSSANRSRPTTIPAATPRCWPTTAAPTPTSTAAATPPNPCPSAPLPASSRKSAATAGTATSSA